MATYFVYLPPYFPSVFIFSVDKTFPLSCLFNLVPPNFHVDHNIFQMDPFMELPKHVPFSVLYMTLMDSLSFPDKSFLNINYFPSPS